MIKILTAILCLQAFLIDNSQASSPPPPKELPPPPMVVTIHGEGVAGNAIVSHIKVTKDIYKDLAALVPGLERPDISDVIERQAIDFTEKGDLQYLNSFLITLAAALRRDSAVSRQDMQLPDGILCKLATKAQRYFDVYLSMDLLKPYPLIPAGLSINGDTVMLRVKFTGPSGINNSFDLAAADLDDRLRELQPGKDRPIIGNNFALKPAATFIAKYGQKWKNGPSVEIREIWKDPNFVPFLSVVSAYLKYLKAIRAIMDEQKLPDIFQIQNAGGRIVNKNNQIVVIFPDKEYVLFENANVVIGKEFYQGFTNTNQIDDKGKVFFKDLMDTYEKIKQIIEYTISVNLWRKERMMDNLVVAPTNPNWAGDQILKELLEEGEKRKRQMESENETGW